MPWFNSAAFNKSIYECNNTPKCNIQDLPSYTMKSYTDSTGTYGIPAECSSQQSLLFVQAACTYDEEHL